MPSSSESGAETPATPTAGATSVSSSPSSVRSAAILGVGGALLAIAGFFLPWQAATELHPQQSPTIISVSGWDIATRIAFGSGVAGTSQYAPSSVPYGVMAATPLLMALAALAIGLVMFVRGGGSVLSGLYLAAVLMGLLYLMNMSSSFFLTMLLSPSGPLVMVPKGAPLTGIGLNLAQLGFFILLAGGVTGVIQQARQAAR